MAKLSGSYGSSYGGSSGRKTSSSSSKKSSSSSKKSSSSSGWTSSSMGGSSGGIIKGVGGGSSSSRPSSSSSSSNSNRGSSSSSNRGGSTGIKLSGNYGSSGTPIPSGAKKVTTGGSVNGSKSSGSVYRPSSGSSNGGIIKSGVLGAYTGAGPGGSWTSNSLIGTSGNKTGAVTSGTLGAYTDNPNNLSGASYNRSGRRLAGQGAAVNVITGSGKKQSKDDDGWDVPRREAIPGFTGMYTPNSPGLIKGYSGGKLGKDLVIRYPGGVNVDRGKAARAQAFVDYSYGKNTSGNSEMARLYGDDYTNEVQRLANLKVGDFAWGSSGERVSGGSGGLGDDGVRERFLGASTDSYISDYEAALRAAQEASAEALRQQIEQGVNGIYGQKDDLKSQYEKAAQQAYIAKMQGAKALPQQLAAQGLTGGATESANLALETNYGNGLNQLTDTYNEGMAQVDRDAANYRATGDISIAQNAAQYQQQMANAALQAAQQQQQLQAQMALAEYNARIQAQQAEANRQWQAQQQQAAWEWQTGQTQADRDWQKEFYGYKNQLDYDTWLKQNSFKKASRSAGTVSGSVNMGGSTTGVDEAKNAFLTSLQNQIGNIDNAILPKAPGSPYTVAQQAAMYRTPAGSMQYLQGLLNNGQITPAQYHVLAQKYQ